MSISPQNVVMDIPSQELVSLGPCCWGSVTSIFIASVSDKGRGKGSLRLGPVLMSILREIKPRRRDFYCEGIHGKARFHSQ